MGSTPNSEAARGLAWRRIAAFALDWCVIVAYGVLVFLTVTFAYPLDPSLFDGVWRAQGMYFCMITLPVILYFTLCECSRRQASLGKHVMGLKVVGSDGERIGLGRSFGRNLGKFFAWVLGHLALTYFVQVPADDVPVWVWGASILSQLLVVIYVIQLFLRGRTVYDYLAGTWVE